MTGQNETPKDIADDTEGHSAKAFSLGNDLEGYSASGRFGTDDVDGHSAKAFKTDDADDDAEGHGIKFG